MKAIVIGATGATGKYLVEELINDNFYEEVIVLVRRASFPAQNKLKEIVVDFDHLENYKDYISADVAFSVMGTTLKDAGSKDAQRKVDYDYQYEFAKLCVAQGVNTFVLLSAIGANPTSSIFYSKIKGELEVAIQQLNFKNLLIFRPASLKRPNSNRLGEKMMTLLVSSLNSIGLFKKYQVIHVKDLAKALSKAVKNKVNGTNFLEVKSIISLIND